MSVGWMLSEVREVRGAEEREIRSPGNLGGTRDGRRARAWIVSAVFDAMQDREHEGARELRREEDCGHEDCGPDGLQGLRGAPGS